MEGPTNRTVGFGAGVDGQPGVVADPWEAARSDSCRRLRSGHPDTRNGASVHGWPALEFHQEMMITHLQLPVEPLYVQVIETLIEKEGAVPDGLN